MNRISIIITCYTKYLMHIITYMKMENDDIVLFDISKRFY